MRSIENLTQEAHQRAEIIKNTKATQKMTQRGTLVIIDGQDPAPYLKRTKAHIKRENDLLDRSTGHQDPSSKILDQKAIKNTKIIGMTTQEYLEKMQHLAILWGGNLPVNINIHKNL